MLDTPVYIIKKLPLDDDVELDSSRYNEPDAGFAGLFALVPLGGLLTTLSDLKLPFISVFSYNILYNYALHPQWPEDVPAFTPGAKPDGLTVPVSVV